jgi:hypothetical protein
MWFSRTQRNKSGVGMDGPRLPPDPRLLSPWRSRQSWRASADSVFRTQLFINHSPRFRACSPPRVVQRGEDGKKHEVETETGQSGSRSKRVRGRSGENGRKAREKRTKRGPGEKTYRGRDDLRFFLDETQGRGQGNGNSEEMDIDLPDTRRARTASQPLLPRHAPMRPLRPCQRGDCRRGREAGREATVIMTVWGRSTVIHARRVWHRLQSPHTMG